MDKAKAEQLSGANLIDIDRSLKSTYLLLLPTDILEQWRSGHRQYPRCRPFPVDDCRKLEKAFKGPLHASKKLK
ncbi:hypothetical protein SAY87_031130 [Trapa incisa]|uniref:Uncharacterized protein n=1 Tax=Trapa incisa TaxID=236973 RepID=A0AAN7QMQ7_9MYRT|nr:hypothetical protein SAY87_031130 [Trapa incisa]